ncbi:MAG TPA: flavodoxin family protein [Clostridia bacterium]|nr:flavodoxin family protein [Clostridia bacterium]
MKLAIIYGNMRHGSTWRCAELLKQALKAYGRTETKEFFLPKDMPNFCAGCFSCIYNGEGTCPHFASVSPILEAMLEADVIVLTSPVYGFDVSGAMKTFLDHLCFQWMSHRPNPKMFDKIGVTICTAAGAGLSHTAKTMQNSLRYWGAKRIFSLNGRVAAKDWDGVPEKTKANIEKRTKTMAKRIAKDVQNVKRFRAPLFRTVFFRMMAGMMKTNTWNMYDRKHWEDNGWIERSAE